MKALYDNGAYAVIIRHASAYYVIYSVVRSTELDADPGTFWYGFKKPASGSLGLSDAAEAAIDHADQCLQHDMDRDALIAEAEAAVAAVIADRERESVSAS